MVWSFCDDCLVLYPLHKVFNVFHCDLDHWPLTLKINRGHPLSMGNICGRFDASVMIALSSILFTWFLLWTLYWPWYLTLDLENQYGPSSLHGEHLCKVWCFCDDNFVFYPVHTVFNVKSIVTLTFDPWPWKSIGSILSPWGTFVEGLMLLWW